MFDWSHFLEFAEILKKDYNNEAALRTVVNRAYYAAFKKCEDFLEASGNKIPGDSHKYVWDTFSKGRKKERRIIGTNGGRLKRKRIDADYHAEAEITNTDAQTAISQAKIILSKLQEIIEQSNP